MSGFVFAPPAPVSLAVAGTEALFPVRRIFCVGRNYADHAAEMGAEVDREAPFYFTKSAHAVTASGATIPYPPGTADFHHEVELVVALGEGGGIFGCAVGLDMTRRDLQAAAKDKRRPWDTGKDFENSAVIAPLSQDFAIADQAIALSVNGTPRQQAKLSDMVWSVPEILAHLGTLYTLRAGDVIFTGTPAGVGAVRPGDVLEGRIEGLAPVRLTIQPRE
ncbi:fumarylpyruvate hydrolase [Rhodobacter viridis]|uniref:Fumarylpyruvate hydrolase n=1 Tax=Rhodobacter viridis TaxID=1054202 RepID=A0A318U1Z5_9RHOB|nr:fumarylacetoacetate hydrolase family protein [Rhodobacter viridis]PYF11982.1 fumarylpyruvate hydrolase [Rhodobacter viridis]